MTDKNKNAINIYDKIANDYAKAYDPNEYSEEGLIFQNSILNYLKPNSIMLDIGCGSGFSAEYFHDKGINVFGIDLSSEMIRIAKKKHPNINFQVADMITFKPDNNIDVVYAGYSMFHFQQEGFEKTLDNIKTYLNKKGILAMVMQEGSGELDEVEPFLPTEKIYIKLYTEDELKDLLNKHGFEVLEINRKKPKDKGEFQYNKILVISRLV